MKTRLGHLTAVIFLQRLYPTFKEWKLVSGQSPVVGPGRLYPTFKEWKRELNDSSSLRIDVYILPLRNENLTWW